MARMIVTDGKTLEIDKVVYKPPRTIVYWTDGTCTTSTCYKQDRWDFEKGLMACIARRIYGDTFADILEEYKWKPRYEDYHYFCPACGYYKDTTKPLLIRYIKDMKNETFEHIIISQNDVERLRHCTNGCLPQNAYEQFQKTAIAIWKVKEAAK